MSRNERHFELEHWVDFVRDLTGPELRQRMVSHLKECTNCAGTVEFLRRTRRAAVPEVAVPDHLTRAAKEIFVPAGTTRRTSLLRRILAQLVSDSIGMGELAEVRSAAVSGTRQLMYRAGTYLIDVRLEPLPGSVRVSLMGQVVDELLADKPVQDAAVTLMAGRKRLAQTRANALGEFALEFAAAEEMLLQVQMETPGVLLELPLELRP